MVKYHLKKLLLCLLLMLSCFALKSQIIINEGSNRNFSTIADEDNEYKDWIELYNSGNDTVNLLIIPTLENGFSQPTNYRLINIKLSTVAAKIENLLADFNTPSQQTIIHL